MVLAADMEVRVVGRKEMSSKMRCANDVKKDVAVELPWQLGRINRIVNDVEPMIVMLVPVRAQYWVAKVSFVMPETRITDVACVAFLARF